MIGTASLANAVSLGNHDATIGTGDVFNHGDMLKLHLAPSVTADNTIGAAYPWLTGINQSDSERHRRPTT